MLKDRKRPDWVTVRPGDMLAELMKMRDAEAVYMMLQIRNSVLMQCRPIPDDPHHLGGLCGMTRYTAGKVIHRLIHSFTEPDIYAPSEGWLSSRKAEEMLQQYQEFRASSANRPNLARITGSEGEENQEVKNTNVAYRTDTKESIINISSIPSLSSARGKRLGGVRTAGDIAAGMMGAVQAVCLRMNDLDVVHFTLMAQKYPMRDRVELLRLFNAWVEREAGKGLQVHDPRALFTTWLQNSQWLDRPAEGRA